MTADRIEKQILLHAPRARVWRALTDHVEFGIWFGIRFDSPFEAGATTHGVIVTTCVDPDVAQKQKPHEGKPFEIKIEKIEPERLFSFRWHPFALEEGVDYSAEPTTLIVFTLEEREGGVLLTVTESGFDQIPLERRVKAFAANTSGWEHVTGLLEKYLANAA